MSPIGFKPTLPAAYEHADEDLSYAAEPARLLPGHRLRLLIDGDEAFPDMLEAIKAARRYVHLETYILADDNVGQLFRAALSERASAGVQVRIMYDGLGSFGLAEDFVAKLRAAGIHTLEFGPISMRRWPRRWTRRDHRKIMVVDGRIGFVGGINIGDDYAPRDMGGKNWRDTHMRLEGPAVDRLERMFHAVWRRNGGDPYPAFGPDSREALADDDTELADIVGTNLRGRRTTIRRHYLHAIERARRYVYLANAYFVPDRRIRRALSRAAARGVDVQVIVSMDSDVKTVQYAGEYTYAKLMRSGVRMQGWRETHMHAKTAVIDGIWSTVGSYNLDYVSLFLNLEVIAEIVGRNFGAEMTAMFEADFARCDELAADEWKRRRWWRKAASWLAYRLRRWL